MRRKQERIKLNKNRIITVLFVIMLIVCAFLISKTLSKYVLEVKETHIQESTEFYFESNMLEIGDGENYEINNWDGIETQNIEFNVKNYTNNLLKTGEDISYNISTKVLNNDDNIISVSVKNTAKEVVTSNTMLAEEGFVTDEYILEVLPNGEIENGREFNIELIVNSTSPYTKQLKATITITVNAIENYEANLINSDNGEYVILNIKVNEPRKDLTVQYDSLKLILDKSGYIINDLTVTEGTLNSFIIPKENLEKANTYDIYFAKLEDTIVLGTDIKVE